MLLQLLRSGLNATLWLTDPAAGGAAAWGGGGHVESARRFTLDHFVAFVETRALNDILVVGFQLTGYNQGIHSNRKIGNRG